MKILCFLLCCLFQPKTDIFPEQTYGPKLQILESDFSLLVENTFPDPRL